MGGAGWLLRLVYVQKVQVTLEKTGSSVLGMDARKKDWRVCPCEWAPAKCSNESVSPCIRRLPAKCTGELVSPCIRRVTCKMYR
jgi:hypothetical protein